MKTWIIIGLIVAALVWVGRLLRKREIEKFREADDVRLSEFQRDVVPNYLPNDVSDSVSDGVPGHAPDSDSAAVPGVTAVNAPNLKPVQQSQQQLKSQVFDDRQRRILATLETVLASQYRVFMNLCLSDLLEPSDPSIEPIHPVQADRITFVICDANDLSVAGLLEFTDQVNVRLQTSLSGVAIPLVLLAETETAESIRQKLLEVQPGLLQPVMSPQCPTCAGDMRLRAPVRGKRAGQRFWLCEAYPKCRGVMRLQ